MNAPTSTDTLARLAAVIDRVDAMWSNLGLPGSGRKIWR